MDWSQLASTAAAYLLPILEVALLVGFRVLYVWVKKRFALDISDRTEEAIRLAVRNGARGLQEMAARKLKVEQVTMSGVEKADTLRKWVQQKWPKLSDEEVDRYIDEELAYMNGMGASGGAQGVMPEDAPGPQTHPGGPAP